MDKKSHMRLKKELDEAAKIISVGSKYYHFKHPEQFYEIIYLGVLENGEEVCVIYKALYGERFVWVRTLINFLSKKKLENGTEVDRFVKVS